MCHRWFFNQAALRQYDLFLVCDVDLPWIPDGLREYPDIEMRRKLFKTYKDIAINSNTIWAVISGTDIQRLQLAISIIDTLFASQPNVK
jgi:nicotinamide riboside kinase